MRKIGICTGLVMAATMSGCAQHTAYGAPVGELSVKTQLSDSVFQEPIEPENKVVFLQVRNSSGTEGFNNITTAIERKLTDNGYTITKSPKKAYRLLQANITFS